MLRHRDSLGHTEGTEHPDTMSPVQILIAAADATCAKRNQARKNKTSGPIISLAARNRALEFRSARSRFAS